MTPLPGVEEVDGEQPVGVAGDLGAGVDDHGRCDEPPDVDRVDGVAGEIPAGDPVGGGVEVGANVLAAGEVVPVPPRPRLVVPGDSLDPEGARLPVGGRQNEGGEVLRQHLREVDDAD